MTDDGNTAECELVGEGRADIVGLGIIVGFVGQALLSLCLAGWVFFLSKVGKIEMRHEKDTIEHEIERKRLGSVSEILMVGNDIQMVLGLSYMVNAFSIGDELDLYHYHLIFDIVSFVGVSNASAMVCWTFCRYKLENLGTTSQSWQKTYFTMRHRVAYAFGVVFLVLTIRLCIHLDEWDLNAEPGRCYHAQYITSNSASHPTADKVYVAFTAVWMLLAMGSSIAFGARRRHWVLISSFLQFPVHLYMTVALRTANQGKLEGEESSENGWDFGQTTAIVLLGFAIGEFAVKMWEYYRFEHNLKKETPPAPEAEMLKAPSREEEDVERFQESYELQDRT